MNFKIQPIVDPYKHKRRQGFLPLISLNLPITRLAIATPSKAVMGTKYVAAENPNGSVDGKLSA